MSPVVVFHKFFAVITGYHHDRRVQQGFLFEEFKQASELGVKVVDRILAAILFERDVFLDVRGAVVEFFKIGPGYDGLFFWTGSGWRLNNNAISNL